MLIFKGGEQRLKHARAGSSRFCKGKEEAYIILTLRNDGNGFDLQTTFGKEFNGLANISNRTTFVFNCRLEFKNSRVRDEFRYLFERCDPEWSCAANIILISPLRFLLKQA